MAPPHSARRASTGWRPEAFTAGYRPKPTPMAREAAASRGDVAAAVKDNPALVAMMQRAMQRMTIEGMLRQAGTDIEDIKQLNRVLQGISKE